MAGACPAEFIQLAERLADASGAVLRRYFRTPIVVDRKADETPVTIADREAETVMRALLAEKFPDHGVFGEEHGAERADAELVWVLDPIDGTRAFIAGKPMFGTLVALVQGGVPVLGIIDQPVARERWIGSAGSPTRFNGGEVATRACGGLGQALLNTTSPELFDGADRAAFDRVAAASGDTQYGGDCYAYGLLASGFIDLVVEVGLKPYDFCALAPVVTGAGGIMTDWSGAPLTMSSDGRVVAAGDAVVHAEAIGALGVG